MKDERTDEILSELNTAIEHDPDRDKNYYQRGLIYKSEGLWEKAEADFAKAFSLWTDPLYLSEWRETAKERQSAQTIEERMAPYVEIINKIKDIRDDAPPIDDTEIVPAAEIIAALALFEEYEALEALFETEYFTVKTLNETVSPAFAYWQPTPIYFIASKKALAIIKDPCKMIRFLSAHGADPNIPAEDGSTMLWNQCNKDYPIEIMKTLLEIGADPNQTSKDGEAEWTPLAYCLLPNLTEYEDGNINENQYLPLESESIEKAKLLLEHNADANLANPSFPHNPPLMLAVNFAVKQIDDTELIQPSDMELIKLLLEKGADPNFTDSDGNTAMILALEKGMWELAELLLKYGATMPNVKINTDENTPLSPRPEVAPPISYKIAPGFDQKFEDDFRELFTSRLLEDEDFGGELWQALANVDWIHEDDPDETPCSRSFRSAGSMIASMLGIGDYIDWYCSGPYETVSEYIAEKMASKGWRYEIDGNGSDINKGRLTFTDGVYKGEIENGKPNGKGKKTYNSGEVYEGDWKDGKRHGKGKVIWVDGGVYEGDFADGKITGKGKETWNGIIYEGDFLDSIYHGKGKRTWPDGFVKDGEWKNGEFLEERAISNEQLAMTKGKIKFTDGDTYEGDIVNDQPNGKGKYTMTASGDVYEGDFVNGKPNGKGKFTWSEGSVYEGDWANGKPSGKGIMKLNDGTEYEGYFVDGVENGKGKITYTDGSSYEGDFVNRKCHGKGKMTYADGKAEEGRFENNIFIGEEENV